MLTNLTHTCIWMSKVQIHKQQTHARALVHTQTHTHTPAHKHTLSHTEAPQGRGTEEEVFKKRKIFKEDLKELTEEA